MPALKSPPLPETTIPGAMRRRIWKHPELRSHSLLVLTFDELRLAPLAGSPKADTVAAIEMGADLDDLLGPLATVVELSSIRRVTLDLLANTVVVDYAGKVRGRSRLTVVFAAPETADAFFTKLWRRLGSSCELLPYKRETWALARAPLAALGLVVGITLALAVLLNLVEDYSGMRSGGSVSVPAAGEAGTSVDLPRQSTESPSGWFNWKFVCMLGGAAAAGTQVWLYRRLTQPPVSLELMCSQ
jgi:hypothetical protein